jgi:hypothetical protein
VTCSLVVGAIATIVVAGCAPVPQLDGSKTPRPGFLEFHVKDSDGNPLYDESGPVTYTLQNTWASNSVAGPLGNPNHDGAERYVRETTEPQPGFVGGGPFVWSRYYHHEHDCQPETACTFDYRVEFTFEDHGPVPYNAYNFLEVGDNQVNSETPDSVVSDIEPWPGCDDGDAAVLRVSGPLQDGSGSIPQAITGSAELVMADCTNSGNWTSAFGN